MILVSYATDDDIYSGYLSRLKASSERVGLEIDAHLIPQQRRELACRRKPKFLMEMLTKHQRTVVWLDADAVVARPFRFESDAWDVGFVPNTIRSMRHAYPVASFVVALQPTTAARQFLETWDHLCQWDGPLGDHHRLHPTRLLMRKQYREISLVSSMRRAIIRDLGKHKENTIVPDWEFYLENMVRRLTFQRKKRPPLGHSPEEV